MFKKIILSLLVISIPVMCQANAIENPDYVVSDVYIGASIDILGSIHVKEAIIVKGSLNGFIRELDYKNDALEECSPGNVNFEGCSIYDARGIKLSKVSAYKIEEKDIDWNILNHSYEEFENVEEASNGEVGKYIKTDNSTGIEVKTYNMNEDGYIVYFYEYYINQAVIMHKDVAELYYTFFRLDENVENKVNIQVTTPGTSTNDVFRFWAHGTLSGEIAGISEDKNSDGKDLYKGVLLTIDSYEAGDMIDVRMTFDKEQVSLMDGLLNDSGEDALSKIIDVETERANAANFQRIVTKSVYYGVIIFASIYLIGLVLIWIYIYRKYDKEYNVNFDHKYYREFTGEYSAEVVEYLMKEDVSINAFNASIMNLIYKKNIEIEEIPNAKKNLILHLKSKDNLNSSESILMNLLFTSIGKDNKVTLKEIEEYSSKYSSADTFMKQYDSWKLSVIKEGKKEEFFERHTHIRTIGIVYFILSIITVLLLLFLKTDYFILTALVGLGGLAFCIYTLTYKKWTRKGREHYLKWAAFKNFLTDFGLLKEKEIPDIALWDKYLVYATLFGIAKKVQAAMKVKLTEIGVDEAKVVSTTSLHSKNFASLNIISSSVSKAHSRSINTINSHMSSGSGFGGGISGGGGFAGGGGGGRGF